MLRTHTYAVILTGIQKAGGRYMWGNGKSDVFLNKYLLQSSRQADIELPPPPLPPPRLSFDGLLCCVVSELSSGALIAVMVRKIAILCCL